MNTYQEKLDKSWRSSEYVVAFQNTGDRGRMRGSDYHPDGVLHRSDCPSLSAEVRQLADLPAEVWATTLQGFIDDTNRYGVGNRYRVCQRCCKGLDLPGARVKAAPTGARVSREQVESAVTEEWIRGGHTTAESLAAQLNCSTSTARRQLADAEREGNAIEQVGSRVPTQYRPTHGRLRAMIRELRNGGAK